MKYNMLSKYSLTVQFDDLDYGGVVHHPKYLNFLERGRNQGMLDQGVNFVDYIKGGEAFVVAEIHSRYYSPLMLNQEILVLSIVTAYKRSSVKVFQAIIPKNLESLLAKIEITGDNFFEILKEFKPFFFAQLRLVNVSISEMKPISINEKFIAKLENNQKNNQDISLKLNPW